MKSMSMLLHNFKLPWLLQEKRRLHLGIAQKMKHLIFKGEKISLFSRVHVCVFRNVAKMTKRESEDRQR